MDDKKAEEMATSICVVIFVVSIVVGLIAAIFGSVTVTIFCSALMIVTGLQPDLKKEDKE